MKTKLSSLKGILFLALTAVCVFGLIFGGITLTRNLGKSKETVTMENATGKMNSLYKSIKVNTLTPRKGSVNLESDLKDTLPDISKYPPQVEKTTDSYIEIFSSPEKAGDNTDGWLVEVAKDFNNSGASVNGKPVSVRLRGISSGTGMDYIVSGKYVPDVFTPSNEFWGEMIKSKGVSLTLDEKKLAGNVAGILTSKKKNSELINTYGSVSLKTIIEAVANNELSMGYTDPFTSSTGLNFLVSTLSTFDESNPLSENAVGKFEQFQTNIPFVASTTLQMRDAAASGQLDGFIMEYQTYNNTPDLKSNYVFNPFGVRHDSPVYEVGSLSAEKKEIVKQFIAFCKNEKNQKLAAQYGFNNLEDYAPEMSSLNTIKGDTLIQAQKLWKEKKNGGKDIAAVFVADVSGSMNGEPLNKLKKSLLGSTKYIGKDNYIGLVTFSTDVNINLPLAKFDINQMSLFTGAVEDMQANGSTAMFDAIVVAEKMLEDEQANNPDVKPMLFVLTDGETNVGHNLTDVKNMLTGLKIPIYTIGYNADLKVLQTVSDINEAASINADTDDVNYKLGCLFNAQL